MIVVCANHISLQLRATLCTVNGRVNDHYYV